MRSARPGGTAAAEGRSAAWAGGGGGGVGSSHVCQAIAAAAAAAAPLTGLQRLPPCLPLRRPSLWDLQPWTELACSQEGELRGATTRLGRLACGLCTAVANRLWRRLGAGCSAIVTAEPREPGKGRGGGGSFLCTVWDPPREPRILLPPGDPAARSSAREGEVDSYFEILGISTAKWICILVQPYCPPACMQCREKGRAVSMWQDLLSSRKREFVEAHRGHFFLSAGELFCPWKCSRKTSRPLGLEKWLPF